MNISELKSSDVGKWVNYYSFNGVEEGKIKSWNDEFIFVVYKCDHNWGRFQDYTGCATKPEDLRFQDEEIL